MKKTTLTEKKAENTPKGGVLVGKRKGQTIIHDKGTLSGYLVGKTHAEGGIKAVNKSTGQALEMQGGEVVITAPAVSDQTKREFEGEMLTNRQILSKINERGGGVSFADGGDIPKSIKHTGASYNYGGKVMKDREIIEMMNGGKARVDLKEDSKKGDHPARDLNNYNDVLDMDADGVVGAETGLFSDGGDLDFLNDVDRVFDEGGTTDLPIISYVIIRQTGSSLSNLQGKRYDSYNEFTEGVEQAYKEIGRKVRTWLSFDFYDENGKLLINTVSYISDQKNTVKNFNPFTGNSNNLKKVFQTAYPRSYFKYNWDEWFAFKKSKNVKTEPKSSETKSGKFSSGEIDMFHQIDEILWKENIDLDNVEPSAGYIATNSTKDFDIVNTLTGEVFLLRKFQNTLALDRDDEKREKTKALLNDFKEWKKSNPTSKSETKQITRVEVTYAVGGGAEKDFVAFDYEDLIKTLQNALDLGAYMIDVKIISKGQTDLVGRYGLGVTRNPKLSYDINPYTITKEEFRKEVFEPFENKGFIADDFFKVESRSSESRGKITDLTNTKIWIGDNAELSKAVQEKAFELGWTWSVPNPKTIIDTVQALVFDKQENITHRGFKNGNQSKNDFYLLKEKEIFASDLFDSASTSNRNFELEKKYLTQRINTLSSELDLKRPILSNDEVAFYQREINKFVSKLRKISNDEMELKPIQARVNGVYKVKWGDYTKQYPETDVLSINGIKSELTFEEYLTVRTPEFKSFFGNWEQAYFDNTYSGVSKIINPKTKEPMPVFHGTNVLFTEWKTYETNNAHYFAVKREMSDFFASSWETRTDKAGVDSRAIKALNPNTGKFLYRCFLDIRNPIDFSKFGVEKRPIKDFLLFLKINYNIGDYDFWTNLGKASGFTNETRVYAWQIIRLWQNFTKYVKTFTTYDGYIFYEYIPDTPFGGLDNASLSFCAFESNQIKFADAYEFNALSNDSRFDFGGKL